MVQGVLAHEMIHMFDYCRNDLNFKNMEHLACSEIRAANLTHCSFVSAWSQGDAHWTKVKQAHQVIILIMNLKKNVKLLITFLNIVVFDNLNIYMNRASLHLFHALSCILDSERTISYACTPLQSTYITLLYLTGFRMLLFTNKQYK